MSRRWLGVRVFSQQNVISSILARKRTCGWLHSRHGRTPKRGRYQPRIGRHLAIERELMSLEIGKRQLLGEGRVP